MKSKEVWKTVEDHPGYEVSSAARFRNKKTGKLLKPYDDGSGYLRVKPDGVNCRLHILVAKAHVPNPDNLPIVNHKDNIKHHCEAHNLEWVTQSQNVKHAWGLRKEKERKQFLIVIKGKRVKRGRGKKFREPHKKVSTC